jgi:signal transduction histidine kinase/ActR/RegA family two-component response regulator
MSLAGESRGSGMRMRSGEGEVRSLGALLQELDPLRRRELQLDLLRGRYGALPRTAVGMLAGGLVVGWMMWDKVHPAAIVVWWLLMFANQVWRLVEYARFRRGAPSEEAIGRLERVWRWGVMLSGAIWGVAGVFMYVPESREYQALLVIAIFAISTAAVQQLAQYASSLYGFLLPALLPLAARFAWEGGTAHIAVSVIILLVLYGLVTLGLNLNRQYLVSLRRRYENIDLIEKLQEQMLAVQQAREQAELARGEADAANRSKTRFLAAASHDLRQPLHALGLLAGTLLRRVRDPGEREIVESIGASVEALENQFNWLLEISRLDSGVILPHPEDFALTGVFDRVRGAFHAEAADKGLALEAFRTRAIAHGDPLLVERILGNLVSNAVRYTNRGKVLIGCRRRGDRIRVEVWDTGVGIAAAEQEKIFEEFYQVGNVERDRRKGLGLGLSTVKRLGALVGSQVSLASWPGRGSVFRFELPRASKLPAAAPEKEGMPPEEDTLQGRLIMLIEDEPAIRQAARLLLAEWGCQCLAAASVEEAIEGMGELDRYPDLILADYQLRDGDTGIAAVARLRHELGLEIPAILVTGTASPESIEAIARSALRTLVKPVVPEQLKASILSALSETPAPANRAATPQEGSMT